jgi:DNA-binding NarL/FixJ family response regulator
MHDESLYALRALRAGAQGYVMKQEALENVINAIREVLAGRPYLSHDMSAKLITNFASGSNQANPTDKLSDRELEILELIGKGRDVHEIARALHISAKTVETHRAHIKEKLNLKNARQVTRFAVQWLESQAA